MSRVVSFYLFLYFIVFYDAAAAGRAFFIDGAFWFTHFLQSGLPFRDISYNRQLSLLAQWPAELLFHFGQSFSAISLAWNLGAFLLPVVFVPFIFINLRRSRLKTAALEITLIILFLVLSSIGFSAGTVSESLCLSLLLWAVLLNEKISALWKMTLGFVLATGSLFSYELCALINLTLMLLICFRRLNLPKMQRVFFLFGLGIITSYSIYRTLSPMTGTSRHALESLGRLNNTCIASFVILILIIAINQTPMSPQLKKYLNFGLFITAAVCSQFLARSSNLLWTSYDARILIIPAGVMLLLLLTWPQSNFKPSLPARAALHILLLSILLGHFAASKIWKQSIISFSQPTEPDQKCMTTEANFPFLADWTYPFLSIIVAEGKPQHLIIHKNFPEGIILCGDAPDVSGDSFMIKRAKLYSLSPQESYLFSLKHLSRGQQ